MQSDYFLHILFYEWLCGLSDSEGYKMSTLSESVHDDRYNIVPS